MKTNKVIFVNSETVSKSFPNPVEKEKSVVFCTQAGDPTDVSKVAIFGEGDEYRDKLYGTQFKWALRGKYCPILGIDDVGEDDKPFYPIIQYIIYILIIIIQREIIMNYPNSNGFLQEVLTILRFMRYLIDT